jgi:hypothetical protein
LAIGASHGGMRAPVFPMTMDCNLLLHRGAVTAPLGFPLDPPGTSLSARLFDGRSARVVRALRLALATHLAAFWVGSSLSCGVVVAAQR